MIISKERADAFRDRHGRPLFSSPSLLGGRPRAVTQVDNPDRILEDLGRRAFDWFQKYRHPRTGLVLDRGANREDSHPDPKAPMMSSVASVGYFLSLLPEWVRLGYIGREEAEKQAEQVIRFTLRNVEHHEGLVYHFVDWRTGKRWDRCEVSALDSAIMFNGCLCVASFFGEPVATHANASRRSRQLAALPCQTIRRRVSKCSPSAGPPRTGCWGRRTCDRARSRCPTSLPSVHVPTPSIRNPGTTRRSIGRPSLDIAS